MAHCIEDIDDLVRVAQTKGWRRIGVDGVNGAGKSTLAIRLADALGKPHVDVDAFVEKGQGGFGEFVAYWPLHAAASGADIIISGVCLRDVLARSGLDVDAHVYVKRMQHGQWADDHTCVFPEGVDVAIARLEDLIARLTPDGPPEVIIEIMRYHDKARPHETADVVFERKSED
jgi:hypothetical protein